MQSNPYAEVYKRLPDWELLRIMEEPDGYEEIAVDTAREELASRSLSADDYDAAIRKVGSLRLARQKKEKRKQEQIEKLHGTAERASMKFKPDAEGRFSADQRILFLTLSHIVYFVFYTYSNYGLLPFYFNNVMIDGGSAGILDLIAAAPIFVLPPATALFYRRKRIGWSVLYAHLFFHIVLAVSIGAGYFSIVDPVRGLTKTLLSLFLYLSFAWQMQNEGVREVFSADKGTLYRSLAWGGALGVLFALSLFLS